MVISIRKEREPKLSSDFVGLLNFGERRLVERNIG